MAELEQIGEAMRRTEMRMVGGSLLVIYEAHWDTLRQSLLAWSQDVSDEGEDNTDVDADAEADAEIDTGAEADGELDADAEGDVEADADAEADGGDDDAEGSDDNDDKLGPPYLIKLIDFGHTKLSPGKGPDTGVLLGLDTTISLLKNRLDEIARVDMP